MEHNPLINKKFSLTLQHDATNLKISKIIKNVPETTQKSTFYQTSENIQLIKTKLCHQLDSEIMKLN
jgi:hypothetical protein